MDKLEMKIIGEIHSDFPTKFGIPRQSGRIPELISTVVFRPEYRVEEALRGMEDYSHLWILWVFSENIRKDWSPTVRPPRLGGNKRIGVFATRSSFRPNPIAMSSVKLLGIEKDPKWGTILIISGGDMMDGTPILDIKPYLPQTDSHPDASKGFSKDGLNHLLQVKWEEPWKSIIPDEDAKVIMAILGDDPRPAYQQDENRIYGFAYKNYEVQFKVKDQLAVIVNIKGGDK